MKRLKRLNNLIKNALQLYDNALYTLKDLSCNTIYDLERSRRGII